MWTIAHGSGSFTTYAGRSQIAAALFVMAGLGLIAAGLITGHRRLLVGGLSVAAGFVWFAPAWEGWEGGPALPRASAMLAARLVFPLLVHLVLVALLATISRSASVVIVATYALVGIPAVLIALMRDPYLDPHCFADCTTSLFVVSARPQLAAKLATTGLWLTTVTAAAFVAICGSWWGRFPVNRRRHWMVVLGGVLLGLTAIAHALLTIHQGFEDPSAARFEIAFVARCVASLLIAAGLVWSGLYTSRIRRAIARTVALDTTLAGSLESALAVATRDPSLTVAYWLPAVGHYADTEGRPLPVPKSDTRTPSTAVVRNGTPVAVISHRSDPSELELALGPDLRLALDNERLRAEVLAQVNDLRESRARIVAAGDERRRQLERNLHDGAQQSLLGLTYDLRRARAGAAANGQHDLVALCDHAANEVGLAFVELRQLAHGIFPAVLVHGGLSAAVTSIAETSPLPIDMDCTVTERLPAPVEAAAYVVVADGIDALTRCGATSVTVTITRQHNGVIVEVTPDQLRHIPDFVHIADRVGATGGTLSTGPGGLRAEIPCAS